MQVDDVDCYGPSHIVMTNSREKIMSDIFSKDKGKKWLLSTSVNRDSLYITLPYWIIFSIIKDDYKEKKVFDSIFFYHL